MEEKTSSDVNFKNNNRNVSRTIAIIITIIYTVITIQVLILSMPILAASITDISFLTIIIGLFMALAFIGPYLLLWKAKKRKMIYITMIVYEVIMMVLVVGFYAYILPKIQSNIESRLEKPIIYIDPELDTLIRIKNL